MIVERTRLFFKKNESKIDEDDESIAIMPSGSVTQLVWGQDKTQTAHIYIDSTPMEKVC